MLTCVQKYQQLSAALVKMRGGAVVLRPFAPCRIAIAGLSLGSRLFSLEAIETFRAL
jgi:hypothetical protein